MNNYIRDALQELASQATKRKLQRLEEQVEESFKKNEKSAQTAAVWNEWSIEELQNIHQGNIWED